MAESTTNGKGRPRAYDHLKKVKQPTVKKIRITLNSEMDNEFKDADQALTLAKMLYQGEDSTKASEEIKKAQAEYDKSKKKAFDNSIEFVFRSIGRKAFAALLDEHPPTAKQLEQAVDEGTDKPDWNIETFPQALVAATLVTPELSEEEVQDMWDSDTWSGIELNELFSAAIQVQNTRRLLEVGNA